jgi:hypothetical protein
MFFICSTSVLIRHLWQLMTVVFLYWWQIRAVLFCDLRLWQIRINQLPLSAARWWQVYKKWFANFVSEKLQKMSIMQQPMKIEKIWITNEDRKNKHRFGIIRNLRIFDACLTGLKNNKILLNNISHRFLITDKLFIGRKIHTDIYFLQQ